MDGPIARRVEADGTRLPDAYFPYVHAFYALSCGNVVGIVWRQLTPTTPSSGAASPGSPGRAAIDTFYHLSQVVNAPPLAIGINPAVDGITGLESYFWLNGYGGTPIDVVTQTAGASIELKATLRAFTWDFGDGTSAFTTTSVGTPYPQGVSDIRHTYDVRSDRSASATDGKYVVRVTASLDASFRVFMPGVTPQHRVDHIRQPRLRPITSSAQLPYKVDEVRSVLTG